MILNELSKINTIDKSNMFSVLEKFPDQINETIELMNAHAIPKVYNIHNVIVAGMGGSAISGDILQEYLRNKWAISIMVNRSYDIPKWANKRTLILSQSYSGDTEETLSSFKHAFEKKCSIISITSGGKLKDLSINRNVPCVTIPSGIQPRSAIAYLFFSSLLILQKTGLLTINLSNEIDESIQLSRKLIEKVNVSVPFEDNIAKQIASKLYNKIPQIYGWNCFNPIARRWAKQLNENSKVISRFDTVPECNHNDIVGWSEHGDISKEFSCILFRDKQNETLQMKTRLDFMNKFFSEVASEVIEVNAEGKSMLGKMMYTLLLGDFVSCYLAILRNKDPTPISIISQLKDELNKL